MHPTTTYHLYNHANGGDDLFREEENYRYFLRKWKQHIDPVADNLAYCLMPNHFHFLVTVKSRELLVKAMLEKRSSKLNKFFHQDLRSLSKDSSLEEISCFIQDLRGLSNNFKHGGSPGFFDSIKQSSNLEGLDNIDLEGLDDILSSYIIQQFSNLFNGYTKAINKRYRRYGSLFAPRFRRKVVDTSTYRLHLLAYIHCNPVLHGFESLPQNWEYSSYNQLLENGAWKKYFSNHFNSLGEFETFHIDYLQKKVDKDKAHDFL